MVSQEPGGGRQFHCRCFGQSAQYLLDPVDTFEPPVTKQLRVIVRADHAEFTSGLGVVNKQLIDQVHEVASMLPNPLLRSGWVICGLLTEIEARTADAPVLHAGNGVLAVE